MLEMSVMRHEQILLVIVRSHLSNSRSLMNILHLPCTAILFKSESFAQIPIILSVL